MAESDIEALLRKYIAEGTEDRIERKTDRKIVRGMSEKVDHLVTQHQHLTAWTQLHEQKDDARHSEVKQALAGLGARVTDLERDVEDTGKHRVEDLQRYLDEEKRKNESLVEKIDENRTWWSRHWFAVVLGVVASIFSGTVVGILVYLLTHH